MSLWERSVMTITRTHAGQASHICSLGGTDDLGSAGKQEVSYTGDICLL